MAKKLWRVLICGDRNWTDTVAINRELLSLIARQSTGEELVIISGGAAGADQIAAYLARSNNIHVAEVKALWETRHRSAGAQRNAIMLALEPDEVIAFHSDIRQSRGTKDMINRSRRAGIHTTVIKK